MIDSSHFGRKPSILIATPTEPPKPATILSPQSEKTTISSQDAPDFGGTLQRRWHFQITHSRLDSGALHTGRVFFGGGGPFDGFLGDFPCAFHDIPTHNNQHGPLWYSIAERTEPDGSLHKAVFTLEKWWRAPVWTLPVVSIATVRVRTDFQFLIAFPDYVCCGKSDFGTGIAIAEKAGTPTAPEFPRGMIDGAVCVQGWRSLVLIIPSHDEKATTVKNQRNVVEM